MKKHTKKLLTLFVAAALTLLPAGCAHSGAAPEAPAAPLAPALIEAPQQTVADTLPVREPDSDTLGEDKLPPSDTDGIETEPEGEIVLPKGTQAVSASPSNAYAKLEGGRSYSFAAAGDNIVHTAIWLEARTRADENTRKYYFAPVFDDLAGMIEGADIAFINQETLMGGEELGYSTYPSFNSPQDIGLDLVDLGFDIVNIANNHMADKSSTGLSNTIDFWNARQVVMIGGYKNYDDYKNIRTISRDGVTIALLAYTYSTNGIPLPASSELYVPYIDYAEITAQVKAAKKIADLVFVSMHWGVENSFVPSAEQTSLAQYMADLGVDVIIGHHPHVVQPVTWLTGKGGNDTLCVYSLGNIVSLMAAPYNMVGGVMTFDITEGDDGWFIENPVFVPTVFFYDAKYFRQHIYLMKDFTEPLAEKLGTINYGYTTSLAQLRGYVTSTIDAAFLPDYMK